MINRNRREFLKTGAPACLGASQRERSPFLPARTCASLLAVASIVVGAAYSQEMSSRPHVRRPGENLTVNPNAATAEHWRVGGDATYDASASRSADGSGSFKLATPYKEDPKNAGHIASALIPVKSAGKYTLGFFAKTANGPTIVGAQVGIYDGDRKFIRNLPGIRSGTTEDGQWEECAVPVFVPKEAKFAQLKIHKAADTRPGGRVWVDDFYFGEGVGLERPPSPKRAFVGGHVRVDQLGNFEVKKNGKWSPFFPLCMYSDNYRDMSVYSKQGWNTIIWTSSASSIKRAKEAVSDFNPDGMLAGFQIAPYTFPSGWAYRDLDKLRTELRKIFEQGLGEQLLLYYWDNENNYGEWKAPVDVINTIKSIEIDLFGQRLHPIYALQGNFGLARVHASRGLVDVSGVYVGGGAGATGGAGAGDTDGLFVLDRLEGQTSPAAFAQFNGVNGPGDMRLRLYNAIILGAKAMGYWRDCYKSCSERFQSAVGPVDKKPWWPDFPNLRREVDKLLPIIREPHWTSWKAEVDPRNTVRVGARQHNGEGYLILANQTKKAQQVTLSISGLGYTATEVRDYFSGRKVATIRDGSLSLTLPHIDVGGGTTVLRIVPSRTK